KEHAKLQAIDACRQRVHSFQESENWEAAFQAIDQALSQFPNDPELIGLRAATERERAIQLREKEIRARLHQAEALREANQLDAAEQALVETLHQYPEDASVTEMLAGIRAEKEQARRRADAARAARSNRLESGARNDRGGSPGSARRRSARKVPRRDGAAARSICRPAPGRDRKWPGAAQIPPFRGRTDGSLGGVAALSKRPDD